MCGIAGWLRADGESPDHAVLARMGDALAHRGPDGDGVFVEGPCGLVHRRLAIVDPEGGAQPMVLRAPGESRSYALVCNGEIYNHRSLRDGLRASGYRFSSRSDNEVLLHGYRDRGEALLSELNGMFAFAMWDGPRGYAVLARDPLGQKPLYYAELEGGDLVFASELAALLEHPAIARRVSREALALYATLEYIPAPHTAIAGVYKLEPGFRLAWHRGFADVGRYADDPFAAPRGRRTNEERIAGLREHLRAAVARRMMADVPLGVFLSGGVDSSAVLAMMAEHTRDPARIDAFTIAFDDPSFDESRHARLVAKRLGVRHHVQRMSADVMLQALPAILDKLDEPLADSSLIPTFLLSRFARETVKVALGGDGGDELLLGYETFVADTAARYYRRLPESWRRAAHAATRRLRPRHRNFGLDVVARRFVRGADARSAPERHLRWLSAALPGDADDPLTPDVRASSGRPLGAILDVMATPYRECPDRDHRQRLSAMYLRSYFSGDILTKVDRASMAASLEVRSPFLDPEVVAHAVAMPPSLKLRGGLRTKYALGRAFRDVVPLRIRARRKHGFGMPVGQWLREALTPELDRLLRPERLARDGLMRPAVVARLVGEHRAGRADHRKILWSLLVYEWWRERHGVTA